MKPVKTILVVYLGLFFIARLHAMVTVEGLLMGEADALLQSDPLLSIFTPVKGQSQSNEMKRLKFYQYFYQTGAELTASCGVYAPINYGHVWDESQAKRSVLATLQYQGIDLSIKAIAAYAHKLEMTQNDFQQLANNLVKGYCSQNVTVFSLKTIGKALNYYYLNPIQAVIPNVHSSPYISDYYKQQVHSKATWSKEFDQAINNFRAFCSWGGDVSDVRLLAPYLKNPFIMAEVFRNLTGEKFDYDVDQGKVVVKPDKNTIQVGCTELICRKTTDEKFKSQFPLSIGSTGLDTDLKKLYCHHFRLVDYSKKTIPQVNEWVKKQELEDPIFETSYYISLLTSVPDATFSLQNYADYISLAKSSLDEHWMKWAQNTLGAFSKDMYFEESLKIKSIPQRDKFAIKNNGFSINLSVTLGEMDKITDYKDKLSSYFELKMSKNYFRWVKDRLEVSLKNIDIEARDQLLKEVAYNIRIQLKVKEKYFRLKMWNDSLSEIIAEEIVSQLSIYQGPLFDSLREEMMSVPVKFSYGAFALNYLKFRADVNSGRLELKL